MRKSFIPAGSKFYLLTTIGEGFVVDKNGKKRVYYNCLCECGNERRVAATDLGTPKQQSCGCLGALNRHKGTTTHGKTNTPIYNAWIGMKNRCFNPNDRIYQFYGARGITVCQEWLNFPTFLLWAEASGFQNGLTLERKNYNGNYEPSNCTWIPKSDQNKNKRSNVRIAAFGETKIGSEWARDPRCIVQYATLMQRIQAGWEHEKALITPPRRVTF